MFSHSPPHRHLVTALLGAALALTGAACSDMTTERPTTEVGTVQMALTSVGSDGDVYRLRNAAMSLDGPTQADVALDEAYGDSPVFEARVDVGDYRLTLQDGWVLQRQTEDGFEVVDARLVSPNPHQFTVEAGETTVMAVVFETIDSEVEFATGNLEVWLGVNHLDCEHGEYETRSCGANLTGRQFNMCSSGWWQGWSECSARCDQGYCLFKAPETFEAATTNKTVHTVGFESFASGSPVAADMFATLNGDAFSDAVTFVSIGASNQMYPWDSDTPVLGQKIEHVVVHGGDDSGEASIRSSAGGHNFSGFDALEAIFPVDAEVYAVRVAVDDNGAGYSIEVHDVDCAVVAELVVSSGDGHDYIIIGDTEHRDFIAASSIVITPKPSDGSPHGTESWSMTEFAFAY